MTKKKVLDGLWHCTTSCSMFAEHVTPESCCCILQVTRWGSQGQTSQVLRAGDTRLQRSQTRSTPAYGGRGGKKVEGQERPPVAIRIIPTAVEWDRPYHQVRQWHEVEARIYALALIFRRAKVDHAEFFGSICFNRNKNDTFPRNNWQRVAYVVTSLVPSKWSHISHRYL